MQMQALLSFTSGQDFNVALLDDVVRAFASPSHPQQQEAGQVLVALQNSPTAWTCVDGILEQSKEPQARYIGLQILEATIQFRWKSLPQVQRDGIKTYIVGKVIKQSQDAESLKQGKTFLNKLNLCLVNLLKQEWPQNWPTFIDEMVDSAKSSELICENIPMPKLLAFGIGQIEENMREAELHSMRAAIEHLKMQVATANAELEMARAATSGEHCIGGFLTLTGEMLVDSVEATSTRTT